MTRVAAFTGTFDPPTLGHLDLIRRAVGLVDRLLVGISTNSLKAPLFSLEERVDLVRREVSAWSSVVEVRTYQGLAVDFARQAEAQFVVRGLRSGTDLDYESQMATMNGMMAPDIDTIFLVAAPALRPIASSLVKDVARGGGAIEQFVPPAVAQAIRAKLR
ncbi:pantetheine-phosphate adenylyltransferase [uncultured Sphingomonas sp.]|uniref:pantetheine-phosphate adenylyltransferase n=1 Tax=uncultured Sphingomonas sp. TaxID=158754 RepID=UPI0025D6AF48|nr:pantetheine-phosphate adenylyltransferase [uncultured Sphingomonas sp.]